MRLAHVEAFVAQPMARPRCQDLNVPLRRWPASSKAQAPVGIVGGVRIGGTSQGSGRRGLGFLLS